MAQQLGFVADEQGVLLLAAVETHQGLGDLAHQVAAVMGGFQIQFHGQEAEQIQGGAAGPVQVKDLIEIGIKGGGEGAGGGGLAGADFAGEQTGAVVIDQELQPGLDLVPGLEGNNCLASGLSLKGIFLKPKKASSMGATPSGPFSGAAVRQS